MGISSKSDIEGHLSLLDQLFLGVDHLALGKLVDLETIDYLPLSILAHHRERVDEAGCDSIGIVVADDAHGGVFARLGTDPPVVHVIAGGVSS